MNAAKKHLESKIASAVVDVVGNPAVPAEAAAAAPIIDAVTKKLAPEIVNATNSEPIWQSRVTIGAVAGLIGGTYGLVLDVLDGTLPTAESLTAQVVVIAGAALTLYGRWAAKKPIGE